MAGHHALHEPLDIRLEERGDKAVVLVSGACDASSHQQVREHLLEVGEQRRRRSLTKDRLSTNVASGRECVYNSSPVKSSPQFQEAMG